MMSDRLSNLINIQNNQSIKPGNFYKTKRVIHLWKMGQRTLFYTRPMKEWPVTWRHQPTTAVIQLLFKLGCRIIYLS